MFLAVATLFLQFTPGVQALPAAAAPAVPSYALASESTNPVFGSAHYEPAEALSASSSPGSGGLVPAASTTPKAESLSYIRLADSAPVKNGGIIEVKSMPSRKSWLMLSLAQHSAAAFDAYSTRRAVSHGAVEADPMMRPFVNSPGLYAAIQVGPVVLDLLARKMQRSQNNMVRRMWWLPQSLATAEFIYAGQHNLRVANQ